MEKEPERAQVEEAKEDAHDQDDEPILLKGAQVRENRATLECLLAYGGHDRNDQHHDREALSRIEKVMELFDLRHRLGQQYEGDVGGKYREHQPRQTKEKHATQLTKGGPLEGEYLFQGRLVKERRAHGQREKRQLCEDEARPAQARLQGGE